VTVSLGGGKLGGQAATPVVSGVCYTGRGGNQKYVDRTGKPLWRWVIPIGGGLLAAVLIVAGTPHVTWYLRVALAVIAFLYISGQSAAYLWSSQADQGA